MCHSRKTNISALLRQRQHTTAIDDEAKFGRQRPEGLFRRQKARKLAADLSDIEHFRGIDPCERIDHDVAHGFTVRIAVEKSEPCDHIMQLWPPYFAATPDLHSA